MKTVSLVLGSGGARGLAHIGVIHWLEENNYEIRSIVGCSIGAVIGGIYAAGKLDVYEQWVRSITKVDIVTLLDLSWEKGGLVRGDKLINTLIKLVGEQLIEDLPFAFTAVATDIKAQKEIWIKSGNLFDAMRASFAIPLLFTPFKNKGGELVDGGVLNPVPIAPTFGDETDITIAVNLGGRAQHPEEQKTLSIAPASTPSALRGKINRFIKQLQQSVTSRGNGDWGAYNIAIQAFETMQSTIARQKLAAYPPDILIEIPRNACHTLAFDRASEMIELGYRHAKECLSKAE
ncbi:MAG: patatin-like phospholipase family protein [Proteobacteria bacterium]|nr:patatin-like phospholipase family protein [Pseudomonadota bacterium]MBU1386710.1 patatin-like phospholipase family protein [Pseudomonadota bacterium]MBU1543321.1 patatin-like phospholipase family protein [Pseudomonadota bacterium]MBU2483152.1 patatin-like phospholipase family protein [Pseudomonadota bacterium]